MTDYIYRPTRPNTCVLCGKWEMGCGTACSEHRAQVRRYFDWKRQAAQQKAGVA